jgi:hypothetical protein
MSRLSRYFDPVEVLKLGKPNGVQYTEGTNNAISVSLDELATISGTNDAAVIDIFKRIIDSGKTQIVFEEPEDIEISVKINGKLVKQLNAEKRVIFNEQKNQFIYYLNKHSLSKIRQNKEAALRNMVVSGI